MNDEKSLGAQSATAGESAGSSDTDAASHADTNRQSKKNLGKARELLWSARFDDALFATAVQVFEESAHLCGSIEATDRMKAELFDQVRR